jgi:hypothetical protein
MLDFNRHVIGNCRKFPMKFFDKFHGMTNAVEKIGIAERNMLRARGHLAANVFHHYIAAHDAKHALVNRNDGTMPAKMLAAAAGFRRSNDAKAVAGNN